MSAWTRVTCEPTGPPTPGLGCRGRAASEFAGGEKPKMGCSISGLNALYDAATGGGDVWINERRFRVLRQIGEGGFGFVYSSRSTNLP